MLMELRDKIVSGLAANFPALKDVKPHGGRFDVDELKKYSLNAPAVRVAFVGFSRAQLNSAGQLVGPLQFALFIITKGRDSDREGLVLAEQIADYVQFQQWGIANVQAAQVTGIENLYNDGVDTAGITLLAVTVTQNAAMGSVRAADDIEAQSHFDGLSSFGQLFANDVEIGDE